VSIILRHRDIGVIGRQRHGRWRSEGRGDVGRVMWHKTVFSGMSVTEEGLRSADAEVAGPGPSGPSHSPNFFLLNVFSEPSQASSPSVSIQSALLPLRANVEDCQPCCVQLSLTRRCPCGKPALRFRRPSSLRPIEVRPIKRLHGVPWGAT